jgi:hypothetical protein
VCGVGADGMFVGGVIGPGMARWAGAEITGVPRLRWYVGSLVGVGGFLVLAGKERSGERVGEPVLGRLPVEVIAADEFPPCFVVGAEREQRLRSLGG